MNPELSVNWFSKEKEGWYEYTIERYTSNATDWIKQYTDIVLWIEEHIENPYRHARWIINPEFLQFRFRYERNYLQFILRWS